MDDFRVIGAFSKPAPKNNPSDSNASWTARTIRASIPAESPLVQWTRLCHLLHHSRYHSINYACILWHNVDDLDVDVPLLHLSRLGSPATVIGVSTSDRLRDATILAGVATHIPHVEILALRRTGITAAAHITYVRSGFAP